MSQNLLLKTALEMLRETNVYNKDIENLKYDLYGKDVEEDDVNLISLVNENLYTRRRIDELTKKDFQFIFNGISQALISFWDEYPATYSFKMRMKEKFELWLKRIIDTYKIEGVKVPDELIVKKSDLDTAVVMIKELHSRKGATKEDIMKKIGISERAVQKNLRKLSPKLYEGNDIDKGNVYAPFRLGGQPVIVDIQAREFEGDNKKYYRTVNTMHPIILQENMMQVATLLQSLSQNFYNHQNDISRIIAIDIWSQLSDYAQRRIEKIYAKADMDFAEFIEILKDTCPTNHLCHYTSERQMIEDADASIETQIEYLMKVPGHTCSISFKDSNNDDLYLENQTVEVEQFNYDIEVIKLISPDREQRIVNVSDIIDLIIE